MTNKSEELIAAAFKLSQAAPAFWADFIKAFEGYTVELTQFFIKSEVDKLANTQGQTVQALHIFDMLTNCRQTMQKAEQKRSLRKPPEGAKWLSK